MPGTVWLLTAGLASAQIPDAPSQFSADVVRGDVVTLTWRAPDNTQPDGYVLEGGFAPGEVAASLALGTAATSTRVSLGPGVYFIRSYAVMGGERSLPSDEIRVVVGAQTPPASPTDVSATASGRRIAVTWRQPDDGVAVDQVWLDVTGAASGSFPIGTSGAFHIDDVPAGTYSIRLRAVNGAGTSTPSAPVTLTRRGLEVRVENQPPRSPGDELPLRFDPSTHPRLLELAARERLLAVVAGASSEFDGVLRLKDWVAGQFPKGEPSPYPPWDALSVLDWIRGGITGGFCAQYAQILLQSLSALGFQGRYIEIGQRSNPYNHYLIEYFSNELDKWIVLDADFNLHFERNGVPLSALEVHTAYVSGQARSVTVVRGTVREGHSDPLEWPDRTMELYYYLRYHLKANHLSVPGEHPFDRYNDMIEWKDSLTVPWERSQVESSFPKEVLTDRAVTDADVANAPRNRIWVTPRVASDSTVVLDLAQNVFEIAALEYRHVAVDGTSGPWTRHYSPALTWQVGASDRAFEVRGVNLRGIAGPATRLVLATP